VQEIERAIAALTPPQLAELYRWLDQYDPQLIDAAFQATLLRAVLIMPLPAHWMAKRTVACGLFYTATR
jgi:hypothetical protein